MQIDIDRRLKPILDDRAVKQVLGDQDRFQPDIGDKPRTIVNSRIRLDFFALGQDVVAGYDRLDIPFLGNEFTLPSRQV